MENGDLFSALGFLEGQKSAKELKKLKKKMSGSKSEAKKARKEVAKLTKIIEAEDKKRAAAAEREKTAPKCQTCGGMVEPTFPICKHCGGEIAWVTFQWPVFERGRSSTRTQYATALKGKEKATIALIKENVSREKKRVKQQAAAEQQRVAAETQTKKQQLERERQRQAPTECPRCNSMVPKCTLGKHLHYRDDTVAVCEQCQWSLNKTFDFWLIGLGSWLLLLMNIIGFLAVFLSVAVEVSSGLSGTLAFNAPRDPSADFSASWLMAAGLLIIYAANYYPRRLDKREGNKN